MYALLKDCGWAEESLSIGVGYMDQVQGEFSIQINLTTQGSTILMTSGCWFAVD